jgi:hypothetical protein
VSLVRERQYPIQIRQCILQHAQIIRDPSRERRLQQSLAKISAQIKRDLHRHIRVNHLGLALAAKQGAVPRGAARDGLFASAVEVERPAEDAKNGEEVEEADAGGITCGFERAVALDGGEDAVGVEFLGTTVLARTGAGDPGVAGLRLDFEVVSCGGRGSFFGAEPTP